MCVHLSTQTHETRPNQTKITKDHLGCAKNIIGAN